jgi:hypothetical protein
VRRAEKRAVAVVPTPTWESTCGVPPCGSTIALISDRPRPAPISEQERKVVRHVDPDGELILDRLVPHQPDAIADDLGKVAYILVP